jgi:hypothetical protein
VTARYIYVDETKERGYVLVTSVHIAADIDALRKTMRGLVLPGQTRIHMAKESQQRRRQISTAICAAGVTATIYDAGRRYSDPLSARAACLQAVISDLTPNRHTPGVRTGRLDPALGSQVPLRSGARGGP